MFGLSSQYSSDYKDEHRRDVEDDAFSILCRCTLYNAKEANRGNKRDKHEAIACCEYFCFMDLFDLTKGTIQGFSQKKRKKSFFVLLEILSTYLFMVRRTAYCLHTHILYIYWKKERSTYPTPCCFSTSGLLSTIAYSHSIYVYRIRYECVHSYTVKHMPYSCSLCMSLCT